MEFRGLSFDEFSSEKVGQFSLKPHSSFELSDAQHDDHNMLSFSSPKLDNKNLPFNHKNPGYASSEGMNTTKMCILNGLKWPFTTSQWIELEQQALIYKYIIANQPIPPNLLFPIIRANKSSSFCDFNGALLTPNNAYGWGAFHLGFSNSTDLEPGRCRRTDGKKWRCAREAVPDQKYCERHINRGRHRSRKPVEPHSKHSVSRVATSKDNSPAQIPVNCSSSSAPLLVPENSSVYGAYDVNDPSTLLWPKTQAQYETTQLSISIPEAPSDYRSSTSSPTEEKVTLSPLRLSRDIDSIIQMGLGHCEHPNSVSLLSWKTSVGGPLGEALKTTSTGLVDHRTNLSGLSLMSNHWEGSVRSTSSQRTATVSLSNSSAGSSPQVDSGKASENGRVISDKLSVL